LLLAAVLALAGCTRLQAGSIEASNPPVGDFAEIDNVRLHYVRVPAGPNADLPPLVFIHGASGNLKDPMVPFRPKLEGRAEMLFLDRPGHGWSTLGKGADDSIEAQAHTISKLMDRLDIRQAIIVGHSFGGAVTATFAVLHPEKVSGLVFLSAASHPWPDCDVAGYYDLTNTPVVGPLFSETLAAPAGSLRLHAGSKGVFSPNPMPETYVEDASIALVLRPAAFRANARQVGALCAHNGKFQPRYGEIVAPTVIVSGNQDSIVAEEIHSKGLAGDIKGSELVWVDGMGHKPDYVATDLSIAAIEKVSGKQRDLQSIARALEKVLKAGN
jgi:pimeloyl-ACP methyl ester carboxylesterase